jgi:hypothetical protein
MLRWWRVFFGLLKKRKKVLGYVRVNCEVIHTRYKRYSIVTFRHLDQMSLPSSIIFYLDKGEWSESKADRFCLWETAPVAVWERGVWAPNCVWTLWQRKKHVLRLNSNLLLVTIDSVFWPSIKDVSYIRKVRNCEMDSDGSAWGKILDFCKQCDDV